MDDHTTIYRLEDMIRAIERLNSKCEDNMKRLNSMMLELKGVIAMVRPLAKKNAWYGDEVQINEPPPIPMKFSKDMLVLGNHSGK